nr:peptide ABC transporter permease [Rhizobium sp. Q54]
MGKKQKRKQHQEQKTYSAEQARGGEIILRTRWRRVVFISGLVGLVVLAVLVRWSGVF